MILSITSAVVLHNVSFVMSNNYNCIRDSRTSTSRWNMLIARAFVGIRSSRRLELYPIFINTLAADGRPVPTEIPTVPSWQYMHAIFGVSALQFQVSFVGRAGQPGLETFWQNALRNDWGKAHPSLQNTTVETAFGLGTWSGDGFAGKRHNTWAGSARLPHCGAP
jgi:hypothetical protein